MKSRTAPWLFWTAIIALAVFAGAMAAVARSIVRDASKQELQPADAIVVFGAAEYAGRPSPVFRARLDHANDLFRRGLAPLLITTGGHAADAKFSEGGVGRDYLMRHGVPEAALLAETEASDTSESARTIAAMMRDRRLKSCIAVSDAYHVFRIRKMLERQGLRVYLAPRADSRPKSAWQRGAAILRESISFLLWRAGLHG